jgi:hypothetical protein
MKRSQHTVAYLTLNLNVRGSRPDQWTGAADLRSRAHVISCHKAFSRMEGNENGLDYTVVNHYLGQKMVSLVILFSVRIKVTFLSENGKI